MEKTKQHKITTLLALKDQEGIPFKTGMLYNMQFKNHEVILVKPNRPYLRGRWVWRTEFFNIFPAVDDALLLTGYYIAYINLSDRFGCPEAVTDMEDFRYWLTTTFSLCEKAAIFGFSRGGLYAINYALRYPDKVAALYLDAPVLDIFSWPAGFGKAEVSSHDWDMCKSVYRLSDIVDTDYPNLTPKCFAPLVLNNIPIILIAGDADETVYWDENGAILATAYEARSDLITIIIKPGCGHHPHSLVNPEPIVDFIKLNY